jgi:hypothetical protein
LAEKKKSRPSNGLLADDLLILFSASLMTFSSVSSSSLEMGMGIFMSITNETQDTASMSIIEEERVEDSIATPCPPLVSALCQLEDGQKFIMAGEQKIYDHC